MSSSLPGLQLICLGTPTVRVEGGGDKADLLWRRNLGLLIYLALSPERTRARDHLIGLLWPDKPQDKAAHSLNEAIRRCRSALGSGRIFTEAGRVTLDDVGMRVDVWELEDQQGTGDVDALKLIRGEFLEGFYIDNAPGFDSWATSERARLRDLSVALLVRRGEEQLALNNFNDAREHARRALSIREHSEAAVRLAIRAATLSGDSAGALDLYREFESSFEDSLGKKPDRAVQSLAERVRTGEWRSFSGKYRDADPPLVGREKVHGVLFGTLRDGVVPSPQVVVISGGPGSGKSRLLNEYAERLILHGTRVTVIRLLETDHDTPWSVLGAIMRAGLSEAPGMAGVDPQALSLLAAVLPELKGRAAPVVSANERQVFDALSSFVSAVAEEQPLAIAVDGAEWADSSTLYAIRHVLQNSIDLPITLVLTVGAADAVMLPPQLTSIVERVGRDFSGVTVRLNAFSLEEVERLVEALASWCNTEEDRDRLARRVALESGGNPLLAVTLLRDLDKVTRLKEDLLTWPPPGSTYDAPLPFSIPGMVRVALVARVARLTAHARSVARAASICGLHIDPELLASLVDLEQSELESALDELEREFIVAHTGERYVFNGRLIPDVIRSECVARGEQKRLRQRAAEYLRSRQDLESRSLRAELLMAEAQGVDAVDTALGVVQAAIHAGAFRTAQRALTTAESASPSGDSEHQLRIDEFRQQLAG